MGVATAGFTAYQALNRRQDSEAFIKVNQISQLLLLSAGQWAVERGLTNAALKSPDVIPAERHAEIIKMRTIADQAFRDAAQRLRAVPAMKGQRVVEAERAFQVFEALRASIDENLSKPGSARSTEFVDGFVPAITNLIEVAAIKLRLTLE